VWHEHSPPLDIFAALAPKIDVMVISLYRPEKVKQVHEKNSALSYALGNKGELS